MKQYSLTEYNRTKVEILKILRRDPTNNFIYYRLDRDERGLCYRVYANDLSLLHWVIPPLLMKNLTQNMLTEGTIRIEINEKEFEIQKALGSCGNKRKFFLNV